ncbi:MAG: molybdopterin converting factor subunit 1 [Chloroflexota bacterium]
MQIRVKLFATLRQSAGWNEESFELPEQSTIHDLVRYLTDQYENLELTNRAIYAAVNQEYAEAEQVLSNGDVVALFPPVSGGQSVLEAPQENQSGTSVDPPKSLTKALPQDKEGKKKLFEITQGALSLDDISARVSRPDCGGITTFAGVVRGQTQTDGGARGTDFLEYEAYVDMAEQLMARIGEEVQEKWPKVKAVSILHRIGRCEIGESSVLIAVATPHRGDGCFEACRYAIERLKAIVPIWKQENWQDGQVWVEGPREPGLALEAPSG